VRGLSSAMIPEFDGVSWGDPVDLPIEAATLPCWASARPDRHGELVSSLAEHGQREPVYVRERVAFPDSAATVYELVDGERRVAGARELGWPTIRARIVQAPAGDRGYALAVASVMHARGDRILASEASRALVRVASMPEHRDQNLAQVALSLGRIFGRSPTWVKDLLAMERAAPAVRSMLDRKAFPRALVTYLARIADHDLQVSYAKRIVSTGMNIHAARNFVCARVDALKIDGVAPDVARNPAKPRAKRPKKVDLTEARPANVLDVIRHISDYADSVLDMPQATLTAAFADDPGSARLACTRIGESIEALGMLRQALQRRADKAAQ